MRILVLDGSIGGGRIALVAQREGVLSCVRQLELPGRGGAERLAGSCGQLFATAEWRPDGLDLIAALVGPGSFTGLRATLSLAQGLALGAGLPLQGVTAGEALRRTVASRPQVNAAGLPLWCVGMARRDRLFLEQDETGGPAACMFDALPTPARPVLLAGDASAVVAVLIGNRGGVAHDSQIERPDVRAIAAIAIDRHEGRLAPRAALPLYIDPPEARLPASGLRPAPM